LAWAERASRGRALQARSQAEIRWAVSAAARRLPGTRCLPRALALQALLRQAGIASELRIGVAKAGEELAAHAWVECEGRALTDGEELGGYHPLPVVASTKP
jgi:hypothetical protein